MGTADQTSPVFVCGVSQHLLVTTEMLVCVRADDNLILQFGRTGKNMFTMDYRWPLTPFQGRPPCVAHASMMHLALSYSAHAAWAFKIKMCVLFVVRNVQMSVLHYCI